MELKNKQGWQDYPNNRKFLKLNDLMIVVPEYYFEDVDSMPLFCEVCQIRFGTKEDEKTYKKFKCCSSCADKWAYSNKDAWVKGWRPDKNKIKEAIEKRTLADLTLVFE